MKKLRLSALALSIGLLGLSFAAGATRATAAGPFVAFPSPPPPAPVRPVTETYFGTTVTDPYRYMENMNDPQVQQFFKDQNNYTRGVLARLGLPRQALFNRIKMLDNAGESVGSVQRVKNLYFYEKLKPGQNTEKLYVRTAGSTRERILVDPDRLASAGKHYTINYYLPSLDGKYVAYGISEGGSESSVIHVVNVATGGTLPDAIDRAYFVGATSWLPDGKSFYYVRFPKLQPGEPETDKETRAVNYLHVLGRNPDQDQPIFGYGVDPNIPFAETDFPIIVYSPVSKYSFAIVVHGVKNEQVLYVLDQTPVMAARAPWKKIVDDSNDVTGFDVKGSTIYLLTHHDAPTYKVVSMSLAAPDFANAKTVVSPGRAVVEAPQVAADGLYVLARDGGFGQISKFSLDQSGNIVGGGSTVRVPYAGAIGGIVTDSRVPGVTFGLTGWTRSLRYFYAAANGSVTDTRLKKPAPVNMSAYTSQEVQARSARRDDGSALARVQEGHSTRRQPSHVFGRLRLVRHHAPAGVFNNADCVDATRRRVRRLSSARRRLVRRSVASGRHDRDKTSHVGRFHRLRPVACRQSLHIAATSCRRRNQCRRHNDRACDHNPS